MFNGRNLQCRHLGSLFQSLLLLPQVLTLITEQMDITNALIISQQTMADLCNVSRPTVARSIKILKERNWIQTVRIGSSTAYVCNQSVFWQQARDKRFYADFNARVIASAKEQDEPLEKLNASVDLNTLPSASDGESISILHNEEPPTQSELDLPDS